MALLVALTEEPFEPPATPKGLTFKALFLFATASARRVSEINALCIDRPFLIQNLQSFRLTLNAVFLPNTFVGVALSLDLQLTSFYPEPTSPWEQGLQLLICLVGALRIYLQCMTNFCGQNRSLFVHWDEEGLYGSTGYAPASVQLCVLLIAI